MKTTRSINAENVRRIESNANAHSVVNARQALVSPDLPTHPPSSAICCPPPAVYNAHLITHKRLPRVSNVAHAKPRCLPATDDDDGNDDENNDKRGAGELVT